MRHVELRVPAADAELAADRLWTAGARAVEERAGGDLATIRSVLAQDDAVSLARLGELPAHWSVSFVEAEPPPAETWRDHVVPIEVNAELVVRPAWLPPLERDGVTEIAVEPGASFGLGDHPTTRLAADAAWRLTSPGASVLDVGCGSGVLGIVAAVRGASSVIAIDTAQAAVEATRENAGRNGCAERIDARATPLGAVEGSFDLVLANILAPVLVALADDLRRLTAPGGRLVLAGVLVGRWDHVVAALAPMVVHQATELGEWAGVVLGHP